MTEFSKTLHRIHDLDGNICVADVDDIRRVISIVTASAIQQAILEDGSSDILESYILGPKPGSTAGRQLRSMPDDELLQLWETEEREEAIRLRDEDALGWPIELQIDPEATEITDWTKEPMLEIEGRVDGRMISIRREALETRLLGYALSCEESSQTDYSPFQTAVLEGHKGFADYTLDEMRLEWMEVRSGFYSKQKADDIPLPMAGDDPEFGK
jgi:hypothetical protein